MSEALKTVYGGVEITYEERTNFWLFTLRGKERHALSLSLAKRSIDMPAPTDKKPFTAQPAYHKSYCRNIEEVVVTSIAESSGYGGAKNMFWIRGPDKTREKVASYDLFSMTLGNRAGIARISETEAAIEKLREKKSALENSLTPFVVADNVE